MIWNSYCPPAPKEITDPAYIARVRSEFLAKRPANLDHLLRSRYGWMNPYLAGKSTVVDLGAGMGLSRQYISHPGLLVTDLTKYAWIDRQVDVRKLPFDDGSIDVFLCNHTIHHLDAPLAFFDAARAKLKPGGLILIQELEASLLLRALQRVMRNEGWSFRVDVFDRQAPCRPDASDHWAANTAIPKLLFSSTQEFERRVGGFKILRNELCECLIFPLSGGLLARFPAPALPSAALRLVDAFDRIAVALFPGALALGRRVVLEKRA